jgi:hypothetical protein
MVARNPAIMSLTARHRGALQQHYWVALSSIRAKKSKPDPSEIKDVQTQMKGHSSSDDKK